MAKCGKECDVYARIVGYLSPVRLWNPGKKAEFHDRRTFKQNWESDEATKDRPEIQTA